MCAPSGAMAMVIVPDRPCSSSVPLLATTLIASDWPPGFDWPECCCGGQVGRHGATEATVLQGMCEAKFDNP